MRVLSLAHLRNLSLLVLALSLAPLAARAAPSADAGSAAAPVVVRLQRTACFGSCPIYTVVVRADGTVEYDGTHFVRVLGHREAKVDAARLAALRKVFEDGKFLSLKGTFDCYDVTDQPWAILTYRSGDQERTIRHYHGCTKAPASLDALEDQVDTLLRTARWVKTAR